MADDAQPDWLSKLPVDVLNHIAQRTRDTLTGLTTFRSVCRTWRAAVAPAPRLMPPSPQDAAVLHAGLDHMLVFPLSSGWSIVVDPRDISGHLSHLATGTTAALPKLNALCDGGDTSKITHLLHSEIEYHLAAVELPFFKEGSSCEDQDERYTDQEAHKDRRHKIKVYCEGREYYNNYISFSNHFRFAIHVPDTTQPGSTEGIVVMMYQHWLHCRTNGMVFCRPGDATWTIISNPNLKGRNFIDFAYFDGKVFALNKKCVMLVFDATTLNILYQVDVPPETTDFFSKLSSGDGSKEIQSLHLLALPHKLLLVKVFIDSYKPFDFHVFELRHQGSNGQLAWCKVTGEGVGGNYELFMDSYHATFSNSGDGSGTRIYHADNELFGDARCVWGYCYNMQDNKLECIHEPDRHDKSKYSTKPSWFVP